MRQANRELTIETPAQGLHDITELVVGWAMRTRIETGLLTMFVRHTSASLLVQENASMAAQRDIERYFARLVQEGAVYEHDEEGPDDMPAHLRAALTATSLSIPIAEGRPVLGRWQGIYLFEHRTAPHRRRVALHVIGL